MRALPALTLALALIIAACASAERPRTRDADVWGKFEAARYGDIADLAVLRVAPPEGGAPDAELERAIRQSLGRRGHETGENASHVLRYILLTALTDSAEDGLGIKLGGALGSSSGVNDFGIDLDLPLLSGGASVRQVSFLFELLLEGPGGALLWRGRAVGRTGFSQPGRIVRPLAPLLLDHLGRDSPARRFSR